ncbi:MAG: 16S rRNA (adenine(1518)-N(6)/adenine(1519)-N(6))-dimethyltransferase RsmA [Cyclobacteriaceae bacterium]|nr:ribosomal RNA small subunit methyltransferase A [Flammeovirgaceae bacterium]MDG1104647.1 16S rRNA (adenine(1518)-N(6)/adenine(1519)-N(6))-dimethyltransferase RsmA [Cyclobacteriaceae bacterium]
MRKLKPKKYLGQHFLKDETIALDIVAAIGKGSGSLLEVGPGMGVLTQHLLQNDQLMTFDLDKASIDYLKEKYPDHTEKFQLKDFLKENLMEYQTPIRVIGNFPYNISSQIFFQVYEHRDRVEEVVCMIQKEVAERIVSKHGNKVYGILSVLLQTFYDIEYLFSVDPMVFDPPPKVNSAVIKLVRNNRLDFDAKTFKRVVKAGFGKRRKTLRNALKELNLPNTLTAQEVFNRRAEQLSVQDFIDLMEKIEEAWKK